MEKTVLLSVKDLKQHFKIGRNSWVKAVDGVSFDIFEGETFSVVGESGSGKSTLGRALIRIYNPQAGEVSFLNGSIHDRLSKEKKRFLCENMQMIFQDPMASLNPRKKVLDIVASGLDVTGNHPNREQKVADVLASVGLSKDFMSRYPHQFSGGQRQRIGIARALIMEPKFIIADEVISALDVSIQAQVINLMKDLQKEHGLTYLFIAHDLSMVRSISDRIAVMHLGHIVELGSVADIYDNPIHPYTKSLLSSVPLPDPIRERARTRVSYHKGAIDYNQATIHNVSATHQVLASEEELKGWLNGDYDAALQA